MALGLAIRKSQSANPQRLFRESYAVMPLAPNSQLLTDSLEAAAVLNDRFSGLKLMNFDSVSDQKRGCFSLVFKAYDSVQCKYVALKFFDPQSLMDQYRLTAFRRESEILSSFKGIDRSLQLVTDLSTYYLKLSTPGGEFNVPCEYFAIEWIDQDIDDYFFNQENYPALEKLILFDDIARGVEVLHSNSVFHRDLKPDNLRLKSEGSRKYVVPIDLGTSARVASVPIGSQYITPVGAGAYASPEAHCGLSANRLLAKYTDIYALGCMLFELFNKDLYVHSMLRANGNFPQMILALQAGISGSPSEQKQISDWALGIEKLGKMFVPSTINGPGSSVPPGISLLLNEVMCSLTHIDYRRRPSIISVRNKVQSAIKVLRNEAVYKARLAKKKEKRRLKLEILANREKRLIEANEKRRELLLCK